MENTKKNRAIIGILMTALLIQGVIGISGSLATIGAHFPGMDQTAVTNLVALPCLVVVPTAFIVGKLYDYISKKTILLIGIAIFVICGVAPAFVDSWGAIIALRCVFGIGVAINATTCTALIAENYEGADRDKYQGFATSFQMLGCIILTLLGGWLGTLGWNTTFYVHLFGILPFIFAAIFIPNKKPQKVERTADAPKFRINGSVLFMWVFLFVFFICGQVFSNCVSWLVTEFGLGNSGQAGNTLSIWAAGGCLMGLVFGKFTGVLKRFTLPAGFFLLAISYVLMGTASSLAIIYAGSFICGVAFSICMPCLMVGTANAVQPVFAGLAIGVANAFQHAGMMASSYIANAIGSAWANSTGGNANQMTLYFGAILIAFFGVVVLISTLVKKNK